MLAVGNLPVSAATNADASATDLLDGDERELLLAVAERMVDTGEPDAPALRDTAALAAMEHALASLEPGVVDQLRWALWLVDVWPLLADLRFTRFHSLPRRDQDASLESWRTSAWDVRRRVFYALRNLSMLGYWSQPETWRLIDYGGPWIGARAGRAGLATPGRTDAGRTDAGRAAGRGA